MIFEIILYLFFFIVLPLPIRFIVQDEKSALQQTYMNMRRYKSRDEKKLLRLNLKLKSLTHLSFIQLHVSLLHF